jgi:hypothetical protein
VNSPSFRNVCSAGLRKLLFLFAVFVAALRANAGPPFVTDDPEPVEYQHWEFYLASQVFHDSGGWTGTSPHVEINYGVVPNLQLHLIAPVAFSAPSRSGTQVGYGDTELGMKYRFVQETDSLPQIGAFPLVEVPSGNASRGLGTGRTDVFIPIWLQKKYGKWLTYGGSGYWINPGPDNRNWWFAGWLLQRQVTAKLAVGAEIFHETAQVRDGSSNTDINVGGTWDLNENEHILFSAGHSVQGPGKFVAYVAFQITFGPEKPKENAGK